MTANISPSCTVLRRLDGMRKRATHIVDLNLQRDRWVFVSDQHRGARNGADDFLRSETAYTHALINYLAAGFTLVALGDCEDLWKESPRTVVGKHLDTLQIEAKFHARGQYLRVWGNHDQPWHNPAIATRALSSVFGNDLVIHEAIRVRVHDGPQARGELLLAHGHHGSWDGDTLTALCRPFVRHVWRRLQSITRWSPNSPNNSPQLNLHERLMRAWARLNRVTLFTGHTHHPLIERCFVNSGCCCFADGSMSAIELDGGQLQQVRWGADLNRHVVATRPLSAVMA